MLINALSLKNFKCFEELDVKFAPITLLTGANSSGKSSLIYAILAVLQTRGYPYYLSLNSDQSIKLGGFTDVVYNREVANNITFSLQLDDRYYVETTWKSNSQDVPEFKKLKYQDNLVHKKDEFITMGEGAWHRPIVEYKEDSDAEKLFHELQDGKRRLDFNYIDSFRSEPERTYYQRSSKYFKLTKNGDFYIDQIAEWQSKNHQKLIDLGDIVQQLGLLNNISSYNFEGGRFELKVQVQESSKPASLPDVGFGISQFLPILVADLQLTNNSCLAISQPEVHLHPKIQATFGNYLANQIRSTQKQYIVETHSEYLLNRIRLLLVTGELKPEDVRVLYFENDGIKSTAHDVEFALDGQIKGAPQGFFDTYGIDVMDIAMNAH